VNLESGRLVRARQQEADIGSIWDRKSADPWLAPPLLPRRPVLEKKEERSFASPRPGVEEPPPVARSAASAFAGAMRQSSEIEPVRGRPAIDPGPFASRTLDKGTDWHTPARPVKRPEPPQKPAPPVRPPTRPTPAVVAEPKVEEPKPVEKPRPKPKPTRVPRPDDPPTVMDVLQSDPNLNAGQRNTVLMIYQRFAPQVKPRPEVGANMTVVDAIETDANLNKGQRETVRMIYQRFVPAK